MNITSKKIKIECSEVPIVNIPSKIFSDVYYLHSKYPGKEWSGHLYFTKQGDINNPSELIIDIKEFVLLDLGTVGSTEIDPSGEQIIDMYEKYPHILTMKQALIHTHHNMRTFFSGTDNDTLLENAANYPFFLSVIVNNEGATIAKISVQGFIEEPETKHTYKYKFNRGFLEKETIIEKKTTEVVYVYTCKINIENSVNVELEKLLKVQEDKRLSIELNNNTNHRTFIGGNGDWKDEWNDNKVNKYHPLDPRFKPKPHKQIQGELFQESVLDRQFIRPTTKESTLNFLTALILQDDDLAYTFDTNYGQAVASWKEEVGEEMIVEFKEYVESIVEDVFENIFGIEIEKEELEEIKIHVNIIIGNSIQEKTVKEIVMEYLNTIK